MFRFVCIVSVSFCLLVGANFLDFAAKNSRLEKESNTSVQNNDNPQKSIKIPTH